MEFEVTLIASPNEPPEVLLQPHVPGGGTLAFGSGMRDLFPCSPEYFGQLILIEERDPLAAPWRSDEGGCGHEQRVYIVPPAECLAPLRSLWLGRLRPSWESEPEIAEIWPIVSQSESQSRQECSLSGLLHELFAASWPMYPISLSLGTDTSLARLNQIIWADNLCVPPHAVKIAQTLFELEVSSGDLDTHGPLIFELLQEVAAIVALTEAQLEIELEIADGALQAALVMHRSVIESVEHRRAKLMELAQGLARWSSTYAVSPDSSGT